MDQDLVDPEDLTSYSLEDLKQLLEINKQTLDYYNKMLKEDGKLSDDSNLASKGKLSDDSNLASKGKLSEDNRKAIEMCKKQIETDIEGVLYELKKREKEEEEE
jgi:hypothetical protein